MDEQELLKVFGDNLRLERLKRRLSQEKLAELANVTKAYIGSIERAKTNPSLIVIYKLCAALEIDPNKLTGISEHKV